MRLEQAQDRTIQKYLETSSKHSVLVQFKARCSEEKGLQLYQTRSHASALFNTLLAICIEKVVYMKTGEE